MTSTTNLAARLLAYAPTTAVVDALLPQATILEAGVTLAQPPSTNLAKAQAKRGVHYATAVASAPIEDPVLLAALAKMPQRSVRRALATKQAPESVLEDLAEWALKNNDELTIDALCGTLPPSQWLPRIRGLRGTSDRSTGANGGYSYSTDLKADRVLAYLEANPYYPEIIATYSLGIIPVCREIVAAAVKGTLPVDADLLVRGAPEHMRPTLLDAALATRASLSDAMVDLVVAWVTTTEQLNDNYRNRAMWSRTMSAYAVEQFVRCGSGILATSVAQSIAEAKASIGPELFNLLAESTDENVAERLLRHEPLRGRLSVPQVCWAAEHAMANVTAVERTLTEIGEHLPGQARVALLRKGNNVITAKWLTGTFPFTPSVEELELLAQNPGMTLRSPQGANHYAHQSNTYVVSVAEAGKAIESVADFIGRFNSVFQMDTLDRPGVREVLNLGGVSTLKYATHPKRFREEANACTAYLASRITARFGAEPSAWELVARMAPQMTTGTIDDFITTVAAISGLPEPEPEVELEAEPEAEPEIAAAPVHDALGESIARQLSTATAGFAVQLTLC